MKLLALLLFFVTSATADPVPEPELTRELFESVVKSALETIKREQDENARLRKIIDKMIIAGMCA